VGFVYRGSLTFLPLHLMERVGGGSSEDALARAGLVTSAALLAGMLGQAAAGRALQARPAEPLLVLTLGAAVPLLAAAAFLSGTALVAVVVAFVLVHFANQPLTNSLFAQHSTPAVRSRVYGLAFALSFGVGALAAGAGGVLAEASGVPSVFLALAGLGLLALGLAVLLARDGGDAGAGPRAAGTESPAFTGVDPPSAQASGW
jgi:predicted MFS family arabinose efflux permease